MRVTRGNSVTRRRNSRNSEKLRDSNIFIARSCVEFFVKGRGETFCCRIFPRKKQIFFFQFFGTFGKLAAPGYINYPVEAPAPAVYSRYPPHTTAVYVVGAVPIIQYIMTCDDARLVRDTLTTRRRVNPGPAGASVDGFPRFATPGWEGGGGEKKNKKDNNEIIVHGTNPTSVRESIKNIHILRGVYRRDTGVPIYKYTIILCRNNGERLGPGGRTWVLKRRRGTYLPAYNK